MLWDCLIEHLPVEQQCRQRLFLGWFHNCGKFYSPVKVCLEPMSTVQQIPTQLVSHLNLSRLRYRMWVFNFEQCSAVICNFDYAYKNIQGEGGLSWCISIYLCTQSNEVHCCCTYELKTCSNHLLTTKLSCERNFKMGNELVKSDWLLMYCLYLPESSVQHNYLLSV